MNTPKHTNLYAQNAQTAERKAREFYGVDYTVDGYDPRASVDASGAHVPEAGEFYYDLTRV